MKDDMTDDIKGTEIEPPTPVKAVTPTKRDLDYAHQVGFNEGVTKGRKEVLQYLEDSYINDPGRPDRGTPQGEALLELARATARYIRGLK